MAKYNTYKQVLNQLTTNWYNDAYILKLMPLAEGYTEI